MKLGWMCWAPVLAIGAAAYSQAPQADPVSQRQAMMKQFGLAMRDTAPIAMGKTPFDAATVDAKMAIVERNATTLKTLFPTPTGAEKKTEADPKIWQQKAEFTRRLDQLAETAGKARTAKDAAELKESFMAIGQDCKSCHETFRQKKG